MSSPTRTVPALLMLCLAGCARDPGVDINKPAPAWTLQDLSGQSVSLSDLSGKVVILNLWATWCQPCRVEIPELIELQRQFGPQGLQIVAAATDQDDRGQPDVVLIREFVRANGMNFIVTLATPALVMDYARLTPQGRIPGIPATFILDRQGQVRKYYLGPQTKETLARQIRPLLETSP